MDSNPTAPTIFPGRHPAFMLVALLERYSWESRIFGKIFRTVFPNDK
jgi:hypothetical protein